MHQRGEADRLRIERRFTDLETVVLPLHQRPVEWVERRSNPLIAIFSRELYRISYPPAPERLARIELAIPAWQAIVFPLHHRRTNGTART